MSKYDKWITENVPDETYGKCETITGQMNIVFPELKKVRGFYKCPVWGDREHWWLTTQDGTIVDPTVKQFPSHMIDVEYEPWVEGSPEPTGKCPNCGDYCFDHEFCCSDSCKAEYTAYLNKI